MANALAVIAGVGAGGASGVELAWFNVVGSTAVTSAAAALPSTNVSAVYTLTLTGTTAGTYTLSFGGQTTAPIAFNATTAAIQTAIQLLSTVGVGGALVTGTVTVPIITFAGKLANQPVSTLSFTNGMTGGTPTLVLTTPGSMAWISAGYVSEDGVEMAIKEDSNDIRAYGSFPIVRKIVKSSETSFKMTFLETNLVTQAIRARYPLAGLSSLSLNAGEIQVTEGPARTTRYSMVVDATDGASKIRYYAPIVEVTDRESENIKAGEALTHGVTFTAYPDASGNAVYKYYLVGN